MYILYQVVCCWLVFFPGSPPTDKIIVDNETKETIKISSITEKSLSIKIKKSLFNVKHVVVSDEYLFLAVGEEASKGFPRSILKFDRKGNYIKEIFKVNKGHIMGMAYDNEKKHIFISYDQKISVFGPDDELLKSIPVKNSGDIMFFNEKIYIESKVLGQAENIYRALEVDPVTGEITEILSKKVDKSDMPAGISIGRIGSFSISGGELYISIGEDNLIYALGKGNKEPVYQIEHLNDGKENLFDRYFSIVQGKVGRFITTRYRISSNYYVFFYDLKDKKQFSTLISSNEGVFDDVYGSGYHPDLRFSNLDNVMYSSAEQEGITTIYVFHITS